MFMKVRLQKDNMWANLANPVNLKLNAIPNKIQSYLLGT